MAAAKEYTKEELNYYRICYVTTDILAEGLRSIFKREWDNRYKTTKGEWKDKPRNGVDFCNGESPENRRRNAFLLATMINGNTAEWDCTMLFYAILYSDCIHGLNPTVQSNVDDLRQFRNEEFAHIPRGHLSNREFKKAISRVHTAFQALGLSTLHLQAIRNQTSFPTEELRNVVQKVDDLKQDLKEKTKRLQEKEQQRQVLEEQLHGDISSFCILPPKPSHDVADRDYEVANITEQLKELKRNNENSLSYFFISGNPGSGKSQLAGLVAKRFFDDAKEVPSTTSFVMTVNAESPDTLLESYVSLARHLKCPEYAVTNTLNSKNLKIDEKITSLKTLISRKVDLYTSWLMVVDNVTDISHVRVHLPERGNDQWVRGQLLFTKQDTNAIPLTGSFIKHISVSKGMEPHDAISLLAMLSGIFDSEMVKEVAHALDYQPLALASAATYVRQVRQSKEASNFGWKDYLKKLKRGQRGATETILAETNPSYKKSMTTATTIAVEDLMKSSKVLDHTFRFLSACAPQPLSLNILLDYIFEYNEEIEDEQLISTMIQRCSLLLLEKGESGVYIHVHQVVHDVISTLIKAYSPTEQFAAVFGAVRSFYYFIGREMSNFWDDFGSLVNSKHTVPHLKLLVTRLEHLFSKQDISQVVQDVVQGNRSEVRHSLLMLKVLGKMCQCHCEFYAAKSYFQVALEFVQRSGVCDKESVADAYVGMGSVFLDLGDLHKAKEYYEHELEIRLKEQEPDRDKLANTYNNLGTVCRELSDLKQAKEYHARGLAVHLNTKGPEHIKVAATYLNLGVLHHRLGDVEQAKEYHDHALAIRLKTLGPEHVDVATSYSSLGMLHYAMGDLELAKTYQERALAIRLKKQGPDHVDVATTYNMLGVVHDHDGLGNLEHAKEYHDRALAIRLKRQGPEHTDVACTYELLSELHHYLGEVNKVKEFHHRALAIRLKKQGP